MALAIDATTPAYVSTQGTAVQTLTTASFTPPNGSLLVVLYANSSQTDLQNAPTNTGGTVSWGASAVITEAANGCSASIWTGKVTASASMTVTAHIPATETDWGFGVVVVTGQAATQNGGTKAATSAAGDPSATITSLVGSNSLIVGTVANFTDATLPTVPSGQSTTFNSHVFDMADSTNAASIWAQYLTGMNIASGSSATINDTAPSVAYSMAIAEILAAAGGGNVSGTGSDTSHSTDSASQNVVLARTGSDTSNSTDSASASPVANDSSLSSDAATRLMVFARTGSDTSNSSDSAAQNTVQARTTADTSVSNDAVAPNLFLRAVVDTSVSTDSAAQNTVQARTGADTSSSSDSPTRLVRFPRTGSDTSHSTDSATQNVVLARTTADTSVSTDTATRLLVFARTTADTSHSADNAIGNTGGNATGVTNDTSTTTDAATQNVALPRTTSDTSNSSDTAVRSFLMLGAGAETSVSTDAATRAATNWARTSSDTSTTTDAVVGFTGDFRTFGDQSHTTDNALTFPTSWVRTLVDSSSTFDQATIPTSAVQILITLLTDELVTTLAVTDSLVTTSTLSNATTYPATLVSQPV